MILSFLGFPCYLLAAAFAFWRPVATLIICGALWVVWTIKHQRSPLMRLTLNDGDGDGGGDACAS